LLRCAATLGKENPLIPTPTGLYQFSTLGPRLIFDWMLNPVGVDGSYNLIPRVAAQRGNPGLSYITASRLSETRWRP